MNVVYIVLMSIFPLVVGAKELYEFNGFQQNVGSAELTIFVPSIKYRSSMTASKRSYQLDVYIDKKKIYLKSYQKKDLEYLGTVEIGKGVVKREKKILIPVGDDLYFHSQLKDDSGLSSWDFFCDVWAKLKPLDQEKYILYVSMDRPRHSFSNPGSCDSLALTLEAFESSRSIVVEPSGIDGFSRSELTIKYGSPWLSRAAVKSINWKHDYEQAYIDAAADRLWAGRLSDDRAEQQAFSWMAAVIGESGDRRYLALMTKLLNDPDLRGPTKHIESALLKIGGRSDNPYVPKSIEKIPGYRKDELDEFILKLNIEFGDWNNQIGVAQHLMYSGSAYDVKIWDLVAERLWGSRGASDQSDIYTMRWLFNAFEYHGNKRYQVLVRKVNAIANQRQLKKHAKKAIRAMTHGSDASFIPSGGWE